ncbi:MAG: DUF2309 domain-containing protein, partial [Verrucomicrobiales bacterium]|nr:DUF2309 domain-containing protein [Verrucomicrobiales bacterium]
APGGMQMPLDFYRGKYVSGEIIDVDLDSALSQGRKILHGPWAESLEEFDVTMLKAALSEKPSPSSGNGILTVAEAVDGAHGTMWAAAVTETIAQFCSEYFDANQSAWRLPWRALPLYTAWREKALINANAEVLGLRHFRQWVKMLPDDAEAVITYAMQKLDLPDADAADFFHRQLMSIRGWAGHVQYRVRENSMHGRSDDALVQLLAIRLAYDAALLAQFDGPALREFWPATSEAVIESPEVLPHFLWQLAHENAWQRQLIGKLRSAKATPSQERPAVQAVFCIDVRSEILRRALEAATPKVETIGFAGFFGLPIEYIPFGKHHGSSQCPVLLTPSFRVRETLRKATPDAIDSAWKRQRLGKRLKYSWNSFKTSAISCFSFVDTMGLAFGPKLFRDAFAPAPEKHAHRHACRPQLDKSAADMTGIASDERVQLALGALRNMGLTKNFARLVLLCGHGSETSNNPYGSGLDCGACGGHAGDANARVGAAILNDPAVRNALTGHGIQIPEDTHFLAGLHNTTTDDVTLFELDEVPATHHSDLAQLQSWLFTAARAARRERASQLGLDSAAPDLDRQVQARSRDWAQVRPEWGLAGNAAFLAAPRLRSKAAHLGGRVFLHNYDHRSDKEDSTLELIMVAPMVVANWINLQYYASTVNNRVFGSGDKVTHNVVGTLGVCQGNGGDLQTGLPLQSVHDGTKWVHEPLRLHVFIEAPRERITAILAKHANVRQLVDNGWLLLFAIEDEGQHFFRCQPGANWEPVDDHLPSIAG